MISYGPARKKWRETLSAVAVVKTKDCERLLVSPPSWDPLVLEEGALGCPDRISPSFYQVPSTGLTREEHDLAMKETEAEVKKALDRFLGFPDSLTPKLPSQLASPLGSLMLNSAGDPFSGARAFQVQVKWIERNVLDYYASLWNARWPSRESDKESYWGYVLCMGSTEGNLHALWTARNNLSGLSKIVDPTTSSDSTGSVSCGVSVVFFSSNINYSLYKCCNIVNIATFDMVGRERYPNENPLGGDWSPGVPCNGVDSGPGTMDIDALEKLVDFFSSRGHPTVIVFNYGATVKGTCDDVKAAGERVIEVLKKNNMYQLASVNECDPSKQRIVKGFWFHVDGANCAAYMPFLEMAYKNGLTQVKPEPTFDFRLDFVSSIVCSGHKFIGVPWPCGIYLIRSKKELSKEWTMEYGGGIDRTISLSRNGHSSIALWSFISTNSYDKQVTDVLKCLKTVEYVKKCFDNLQRKIDMDLWVCHTPPSLSVLFRRPNGHILVKYTLSCSSLVVHSEEKLVAQLYVMKHVTPELIDSLMEDLSSPDAFVNIGN